MQPRSTVITVSYHSQGVLPGMIASLPDATPLIIVDNAPAGDAALADLARQAGARLIGDGTNRGFGVACNQGAAQAQTEFLFFVNPDVRLAPGCLAALEAAMDAAPDAVAANPRMRDGKGRPAFKRRSTLLPRAAWLGRGWPAQDRAVPVLSGAAFFVRRADFEAVGGFDPAIFLYHEDDDLALRLAAQRGRLLWVGGAEASHLAGQSSVRSARTAALKAYHLGQSRVYAMRKHGLAAPFARSLGHALAALANPAVWLSRRKRAKQLALLRGVWSVKGGGA